MCLKSAKFMLSGYFAYNVDFSLLTVILHKSLLEFVAMLVTLKFIAEQKYGDKEI